MHPYDLSILSPAAPIAGGRLRPFTFGRYVAFIALCPASALLALPSDPAAGAGPDDAELAAYAFCVAEKRGYLAAVAALPPEQQDVAIVAGTSGFSDGDWLAIRAHWEQTREAIQLCGVDVIPGRESNFRTDCPVPDEDRSWPTGNAGLVHAVARGTGWAYESILWDLPLAAFLSHAHCELTLSSAICAPRGYRASKRAEVAEALATAAVPVDVPGDDQWEDDEG